MQLGGSKDRNEPFSRPDGGTAKRATAESMRLLRKLRGTGDNKRSFGGGDAGVMGCIARATGRRRRQVSDSNLFA